MSQGLQKTSQNTGTQIGIANPFLATVPIKFGEHSCLFRSAKTSFFHHFGFLYGAAVCCVGGRRWRVAVWKKLR